jgi:dihydroneopterin aldolase
MSDLISLIGIQGLGFHGVFPDERSNGQTFIVDAYLSIDLRKAGASDDLTATVNYAQVADLILTEITGSPVSLLETLATRISNNILAKFPLVNGVKIVVHKPEAPITVAFKDVSVTIERVR